MMDFILKQPSTLEIIILGILGIAFVVVVILIILDENKKFQGEET